MIASASFVLVMYCKRSGDYCKKLLLMTSLLQLNYTAYQVIEQTKLAFTVAKK